MSSNYTRNKQNTILMKNSTHDKYFIKSLNSPNSIYMLINTNNLFTSEYNGKALKMRQD